MRLALLAAFFAAAPALGATYYVSPSGSDANGGTLDAPWRTIQRAADTLAPGDTAWIRSGTYHERVVVTRSGASGAPITFAAYPGETPVLDGTGVSMPDWLSGLFEISVTAYVDVRGLRVQNVGPNAENAGFLVASSQHVLLAANVTEETRSSGIGVWGCQDVTLDGNELIRACHEGTQEQISIGGTTGFVVTGNRVHDAGGTANGGEGICLKDGSSGGWVHGNTVWNVPQKVGIYVDAWDKHTFDIEVDGNVVHDCADGIALSSEMGGLLENVRVTNNVVYANTYRGLTVSDWGTAPSHPMLNVLVANNTFVEHGAGGWGGGIAVDGQQITGVALRNNIVFANASFQVLVASGVPAAQLTVDHNLIHPFMQYEGEITGTDSIHADPLFVNTATHDYHLSASSPAIDKGSASKAPAFDFDGRSRPQGAGWDIGAFEWSASCVPSARELCLSAGRFRIRVDWTNPYDGGSTGSGTTVPLTADTGMFWFFDARNIELVVKVLDGRAANGRFWVFYGALSDVEYTLTLTDTMTGAVRSYHNTAGNLGSVADTGAFVP